MGREFIDLFDRWAKDYDHTVSGVDDEYREVFEHYEQILKAVADRTFGHVVEFGVGTGNLSAYLLNKVDQFTGIEPSKEMRQVAEKKLNQSIYDGDFLSFPQTSNVDCFVSSYAFHHLTHEEKKAAVAKYYELLPKSGKVVFADTIFINEEAKKQIIDEAKHRQHLSLVEDLQTEYYPTVDEIKSIFEGIGFQVTLQKMNKFVMILEAIK